jgi:hypothetical protein
MLVGFALLARSEDDIIVETPEDSEIKGDVPLTGTATV